MADMQKLIARLEAAEAGSRELDALVWKALNPRGEIAIKGAGRPGLVDWRCRIPGATIANSWTNPGRYTTSLDAALALAERVGFPAYSGEIQPSGRWKWKIASNAPLGASVRGPKWPSGVAKTPSLALCIAILKAKAQGEGG